LYSTEKKQYKRLTYFCSLIFTTSSLAPAISKCQEFLVSIECAACCITLLLLLLYSYFGVMLTYELCSEPNKTLLPVQQSNTAESFSL